MVDGSNVSGLGMVAVAVVSTGVILASYYHLHRRLESNPKVDKTIIDATTGAGQQMQSSAKTKKVVRFADQVATTSLSSDGDELRRATATAGAGGKVVRPALRKAACSSTRLAH